jgi:hypothetical protein
LGDIVTIESLGGHCQLSGSLRGEYKLYQKKKWEGNFTNPALIFTIFADILSTFKNSHFGILNFRFVSNTPMLLNIVVKLNEKIRKMTKGILVI